LLITPFFSSGKKEKDNVKKDLSRKHVDAVDVREQTDFGNEEEKGRVVLAPIAPPDWKGNQPPWNRHKFRA
jgi:hypothetical protein